MATGMRGVAALMVLALLLSSGCERQVDEQQELADLQQGLVYSNYQRLSDSGIATLLEGYNHELVAQSLPPATSAELHGAVALLWGLANKPTLALAEAELARQADSAQRHRVLIDSVAAVALYQQGWPGLATATAEGPRQAGATLEQANEVQAEQISLFLALGYLGYLEQDEGMIHYAFEGLATVTGYTFLPTLGKAGLKLQQGELQEGLVMLKSLLKDPSLPAAERQQIQRLISELEAQHGALESPLFMPRLMMSAVAGMVLEQAGSSAARLLLQAQGFIDGIKLPAW